MDPTVGRCDVGDDLAAFESLHRRTSGVDFSPSEIVAEMRRCGFAYRDSTIRTHASAHMVEDGTMIRGLGHEPRLAAVDLIGRNLLAAQLLADGPSGRANTGWSAVEPWAGIGISAATRPDPPAARARITPWETRRGQLLDPRRCHDGARVR